ncbi:MAG: Mrp/NBP35 family ATP-binding protein [SAR324 cluster bacterium]|uniref:Iron-sulfur cluster carrier protein n=1 Tax=SAR324 cluster bacterium TaxID=2024889 RepID=A0A7X9FT92_9DELT|nr:Mrp/NBP35 family ATP-binding protein [SAR324 cluster bacterium]
MTYIVPVISGKGGVGKSTIAVNLSIALAKQGRRVALIDSDFYGPSIPTLLGGGQVLPDSDGKLIPLEKNGLKYISIGFFLSSPDEPVIWRGPMFNKALSQMFNDVKWGDAEYFIVDMPPGTGDAQLSLAQHFQLSGAIVVTTPQELALVDVRKAINMMKKVNVPILGIVENMSAFIAPDGSRHEIFGSGGGQKLSEIFDVPLLTSIPIDPEIRVSGDRGEAIAASELGSGRVFHELARKVVEILAQKLEKASALKISN